MIKLVAFLTRLPHVTHDAFRDYYENQHVPLVLNLMPSICGYERNYPDLSKVRPPEGKTVADVIDWDAMTVFRFHDRDGLNAYKAVMRDETAMAIIRADEAKFLDGSKSRLFMVDEHLSQIGDGSS